MSGYVDLHCHYIPGVDDGVRTLDESRALLEGLMAIGYERVVATPHIRSGMFDNRAPQLRGAFGELEQNLGAGRIPTLGLGAEHYFDDVAWELLQRNEGLLYPGGHAVLVEFHYEIWPRGVVERFFDLQLRGVRPVLAHPERYRALFRNTDDIDPLLDAGVVALLDVMSLVGKYGRRSQSAAERMLDEGVYYAACSDAHRPADVADVERGIAALRELVGNEEAQELLSDNPRRILSGTVEL